MSFAGVLTASAAYEERYGNGVFTIERAKEASESFNDLKKQINDFNATQAAQLEKLVVSVRIRFEEEHLDESAIMSCTIKTKTPNHASGSTNPTGYLEQQAYAQSKVSFAKDQIVIFTYEADDVSKSGILQTNDSDASLLFEIETDMIDYKDKHEKTNPFTAEVESMNLFFKGDKVVRGDANEDGEVNMKDILLIRKYMAKFSLSIDIQAADYNLDGNVNMKDILAIRKYMASKPV